MEPPERLTIRWDGFMVNRRKSLRELREKDEFNDVTLIAGDGKPVRAQQVILAGGSSFFYTILKDNVHEDPSIYLTGVKYENLVSLLDYIYTGEANIPQEDFNQFKDIVEELKVQGLFKIGTLEETDDKKEKSNSFTPASLQSQATHEEPCPSLKVSNPHSSISSTQDPVAIEERPAATRITALHEGRVVTRERSTAPKISAQHEEGRLAIPERASQERASKNPDIVTSSRSKNPFPQSTCMEDNDNTCNFKVKVEVEDASLFNVYYGTNKYGEAYIREVSKRVDVAIPSSHESQEATAECASSNPDMSHSNNTLPKSTSMEDYGDINNVKVEVEDNVNFDVYYGKNKHGEEYIRNVPKRVGDKVQRTGLCREQKNYQSVFTGRNEENNNSVSDAQVKQAKILDNDLSIHDWYQQDTHPMKKCSVNIKRVTIPKLPEVSSKSSISSENCDHEENLDKKYNSMRSFDREGMVNSSYDMIDTQVEDKSSHTGDKTYWYQCEVCHKKFPYSSKLNQHKRAHTGEKPYECSVCHKKFGHLANFNQHKRIHIHCEVCHKKFPNLSKLKQHKRVHTGEKPYECSVCHKKFGHLANFNKHKRVHTGEKRYQCSVCHRKFSLSTNLYQHNRVHTGEKPYQCLVCHKKFTRLSNFYKHKRVMVHTGEKFEKN